MTVVVSGGARLNISVAFFFISSRTFDLQRYSGLDIRSIRISPQTESQTFASAYTTYTWMNPLEDDYFHVALRRFNQQIPRRIVPSDHFPIFPCRLFPRFALTGCVSGDGVGGTGRTISSTAGGASSRRGGGDRAWPLQGFGAHRRVSGFRGRQDGRRVYRPDPRGAHEGECKGEIGSCCCLRMRDSRKCVSTMNHRVRYFCT